MERVDSVTKVIITHENGRGVMCVSKGTNLVVRCGTTSSVSRKGLRFRGWEDEYMAPWCGIGVSRMT